MSSGATSTPRPLPALARIWDGAVTPLDLDRARASRRRRLPGAARGGGGRARAGAARRAASASSICRARSGCATTPTAQRWYPATAALPDGVVYGLPSAMRAAIRDARLVVVPGLLSDRRAAGAGAARGRRAPDRRRRSSSTPSPGSPGAGKTPTDRTHFSENHGSVAAYGVFAHRHTAEIEQELGARRSRSCRTWCRSTAAFSRRSTSAWPPGTTEAQVGDGARRRAYADAPFVRLTGAALPEIKHVAHTNFCDIGWRVDAGTRPARARVGHRQPGQGRRRARRCRT